MPDFRRGADEIRKANEAAKSGSKDFRPFLPSIYWKADGESHYVLILNAVEDIPLVQYHSFLELGEGRYDQAIARTDPALGERVDPIEKAWKYPPRATNIAIAVELEPDVVLVDGYQRPRGFSVATVTFDRKVRDDEGNATDETEEVEAPKIGYIAQSPNNFFNIVSAYDATEGPINSTALKITRIGKDNNTTYNVTGYEGQEINLSNLIELIGNVSYVDDVDQLYEDIDGMDDEEAALVIGNVLLDKRLEELADGDRYDQILEQISEPYRYAKKDAKKDSKKAERPARPSQRRSRTEPVEDTPAEPVAEEKEKPKARARRSSAKVTKESPVEERLSKLKQRSVEAAAA